MSDRSRLMDQIRHYRELAKIAQDCSRRSKHHQDDYLELAKQWNSLADFLEDNGDRGARDAPKTGLLPAVHSPPG